MNPTPLSRRADGPDPVAGPSVAAGPWEGAAQLLGILSRTADGMVALDSSMRVVGWNEAAEQLLGYSASEAIGRRCFEILSWTDRMGNAVCERACLSCARAKSGELVETREVLGRSKTGRTIWLSVSTLVPPDPYRGRCYLVHLLREVALPPELERLVTERLGGTQRGGVMDRLSALTTREREILALMTAGMSTQEMSDHLVVSRATVRTHIQHILANLGVRSRVQAVAIALRNTRSDPG